MLSCGTVLIAKFLPLLYPRILEHKDCAHEVHIFGFLAMDPYFPEFVFGVKCLLRSERWNSRPLTGLKLNRGAVKRNGKGCVINACVFP